MRYLLFLFLMIARMYFVLLLLKVSKIRNRLVTIILQNKLVRYLFYL